MKLIMLSPPGAGKGTHCAWLTEETGVAHISSGDLLRAEIARGSELGHRLAEYTGRGALVPDDVIFDLLVPVVVEAARRHRRLPARRVPAHAAAGAAGPADRPAGGPRRRRGRVPDRAGAGARRPAPGAGGGAGPGRRHPGGGPAPAHRLRRRHRTADRPLPRPRPADGGRRRPAGGRHPGRPAAPARRAGAAADAGPTGPVGQATSGTTCWVSFGGRT